MFCINCNQVVPSRGSDLCPICGNSSIPEEDKPSIEQPQKATSKRKKQAKK